MKKKIIFEYLAQELDCYILIYKTKSGEYRVNYKHTKEEKSELKSIILNKLLGKIDDLK